MKRFAVKIGEVHIRSDKPVTNEERERVLRQIKKRGVMAIYYFDDLEVVLTVNSH